MSVPFLARNSDLKSNQTRKAQFLARNSDLKSNQTRKAQ
jgi:hypothetical protein